MGIVHFRAVFHAVEPLIGDSPWALFEPIITTVCTELMGRSPPLLHFRRRVTPKHGFPVFSEISARNFASQIETRHFLAHLGIYLDSPMHPNWAVFPFKNCEIELLFFHFSIKAGDFSEKGYQRSRFEPISVT